MNAETMGSNAGILWNYLVQTNGSGATLTDIRKSVGLRRDEAIAALGWLAREGKLSFEKGKRTTTIRLADDPSMN